MELLEITDAASGATIAERAELADGHLTRMRGLLGRKGLGPGAALILRPCSSIHTWFMRFPLDVVFADRDGQVLKVVRGLKPWRFSAARGSHIAIEFEAGCLDPAVRQGTRIALSPGVSAPA